MKPPVPARQTSPSQQNLAATVTLAVLTLVFLLIPVLAGRTRTPLPALDSAQPTVSDALNRAPTYGPAVPPAYRPWPSTTESAWAPSSDFVGRMQRMSLLMLGMSLFIFLTLKTAQRFGVLQPARGGSRGKLSPLMEVLEKQTVAPGVNLALVRVGDKATVLGFTDHSVNTVCQLSAEEWQGMCDRQQAELDEQETAREAAAGPAPEPGQVYRQIFRQYLSIIPGWGAKRS